MAEDDEKARASSHAPADAAVLAAASNDPALREHLQRYLDRQSELALIQIKEALREDDVRHWSLRVRHVSDVLKLGFEIAIAFIVIAIAIAIGAAIWSASRADGLVIESFDVPASLADTGLSGNAVASKLLDRLTMMQSATNSTRAASTYTNDWTGDIKLEIPDTGVSLGEAIRYLHGALGHEMHLSGGVYRDGETLKLTVRLGGEAGQTFSGASIDEVVEKAADAVYRRAQPYRYAIYLTEHGKNAESEALLQALAENGSREDRAWAYVGLGLDDLGKGRLDEARADLAEARKFNPVFANPYGVLSGIEGSAGHDEASFAAGNAYLAAMHGAGGREWEPEMVEPNSLATQAGLDEYLGHWRVASGEEARSARGSTNGVAMTEPAFDLIQAHEVSHALARLAEIKPHDPRFLDDPEIDADAALFKGVGETALGHWADAVADIERSRAIIHTLAPGDTAEKSYFNTFNGPFLAYAYEMVGEPAKADAVIAAMPRDCDICLRAAGRVAAHRHDWATAEKDFAEVSARAPSIPYADTEWGAMLMAKGDLSGAIAKFDSATRKSPGYADPWEMWGEALIAQNRSDLALAKFAQAAKAAPNWGRLHLKWGEALWWSGDKAGARKHFATAAGLDLTTAEKTELARVNHG